MKLPFPRLPAFLLGSVFYTVLSLSLANAMSDRPSQEEALKPAQLTHITFMDRCSNALAISYRFPAPNALPVGVQIDVRQKGE